MKDKKFPLISVVMLNYNGLEYLKRTIPPILKLDYPNYEFIIVDNGSNDGSLQFIKKFKKIKVIENKKNLGLSRGKNLGIKKANGEYIFSIDNDIVVNINKNDLERLINFYKEDAGFIQFPLKNKNSNRIFYYGVYFSFYGLNMHRPSVDIKKILNLSGDFIEIGGPTGGCFFCSKKNWEKIGGFDESQTFNIDDADIGSRSMIYGYKNYLYTKDYFIHLGIGKTLTIKNYCNKYKLLFSGHARSIIKNYSLKNLILLFPIFFIFQSIKTIRYSIKKRSPTVLLAFLKSLSIFIKNLPDTFRQRKIVQSKRIIKKDIFLEIKVPRFK